MTAEEFFKETSPDDKYGLRAELITIGIEKMIYEIMVRFARLKAQEALEAAYENAEYTQYSCYDIEINKDSILNSYDINSIV